MRDWAGEDPRQFGTKILLDLYTDGLLNPVGAGEACIADPFTAEHLLNYLETIQDEPSTRAFFEMFTLFFT